MADTEFVPEVDEDEIAPSESLPEEPIKPVAEESKVAESSSAQASTQEQNNDGGDQDFKRRYINEKWYGRSGESDLLEFVNDTWQPVDPDQMEFLLQFWYAEEEKEKQIAKNYTWNEEKQEWEPKSGDVIDEDMIAQYQQSYGVQYDDIYKKMDDELREKTEKLMKEEEEKKEKKRKKKAGEDQKAQGWVDLGDKTTAVYVSNLPTDLTEEEFKEFMSKCGVIQQDARNNKPKLKLYRDETGDLKGDGRCCYIKRESVELACSILDGSTLKGKQVTVEEAHFAQKGDFDPTKKKRKLTPAQKKRYMEQQNKIFEWQPEKPRNYRPPSDCCVIVKNLFTLEMMAKNAALLMDLKEEMEQSCQKYGTVKKVVVYDNNPEGVVSVSFTTTDESDMAVKYLQGRVVDGRKLTAELWDGKTKYKVAETAEEAEARRVAYEKFIGADEDNEETE